MSARVKRSRRTYNSPLRAGQAGQTRRAILESAFRLFATRGYAGTTIAAIAEDAGVSPETIYVSLGGKRGVLEGAIEMVIENQTTRDDAWWAAVDELPGAPERLEQLVEYSCSILARTRPIHAVIRGAADKEPFAAELGRRLLQERLVAQTERIRRYIGDELRPGLSADEAGQRYVVLAGPEVYYLLTVELGWSAEQHRAWLTDVLKRELLNPPELDRLI